MKIFCPVTNQLPSASCSALVRRRAMSLPASGSVMSMQPQASPRTISSMKLRKRVSRMVPWSGSIFVDPSRTLNSSIAIAMPPWKPWCAITLTSARPNSSEARK